LQVISDFCFRTVTFKKKSGEDATKEKMKNPLMNPLCAIIPQMENLEKEGFTVNLGGIPVSGSDRFIHRYGASRNVSYRLTQVEPPVCPCVPFSLAEWYV